jgi:tight adherence protein B
METNQLIVVALATACAGGLAYALIYPYLSGDARAEKRQAALINQARSGIDTQKGAATTNRRAQVAKNLKELEDRQKARVKVSLEDRIAQAGLDWDTRKFWIASVVIGLVSAAMLLAFSGSPIMAVAGLFIGFLGVPRWMLSYLKKKRLKRFVDEFPNAMDVIVRGVKSGLPLGDCLRIIAVEAAEPVKTEFRHIIESQALGLTLAEACERIYRRVPVQEANFFGIVISIQQKSGGNLSETLSNLSRVLRERKKMKGKIAAMSMEAKASAVIIAALPFVVAILVYLTSPAYIELLWTKNMGKLVMLAAGFWMFLGIMTMRKMINFDV